MYGGLVSVGSSGMVGGKLPGNGGYPTEKAGWGYGPLGLFCAGPAGGKWPSKGCWLVNPGPACPGWKVGLYGWYWYVG